MTNHPQERNNVPIEIICEDNECDFAQVFDPLPMDATMSESSTDLLSNLMMDRLFSPSKYTVPNRKGRRVCFQENPAEVNLVQSFACLGEDERRGLWYLPCEIEHFRTNARYACRTLRKNPLAYPQDVTRGLELRTSLERQWRKHLTLTCIVNAQVLHPQIDPFRLAEIAHDCTRHPRKEAIAQGKRDFLSAYYSIGNNSLLLEEPIDNTASVAAGTRGPYQFLSRLQKRSSPIPTSYHCSEEFPHLAKRRCSMMQLD